MTNWLRASLTALLLCICGHVSADINALSPLGPTGGMIHKVIFGPKPGTALLLSLAGLYRSDDGGSSWKLADAFTNGGGLDIALDPSDPNRIYVVRENPWPLWVSTDGGASWSAAPHQPTGTGTGTSIVVSHDGATLCVVLGGAMECSVDRGQTWQVRGAGLTQPNISILLMSAADSNTLYAVSSVSATTTGNLVTHDGGLTWQPLPVASIATGVGASDMAVQPSNTQEVWLAQSDGLWMSADGGQHWINRLTTGAILVRLDPINPAVLYVSTYPHHVLRSADSGLSWTDVTGDRPDIGSITSIAIDPTQTSRLLIGGTAGVALSLTSGVTWSTANSGNYGTLVSGFSADPTIDRIYIGAPLSGFFHTEGGSGSLLPLNNDSLEIFDPNNYSFGPILAVPGSVTVSLTTGFARSTDGGATWSLNRGPTAFNSPFIRAVAAAPPQVFLAASSDSIYRSNDGGSSWMQITAGLLPGAGINTYGKLLSAQSDPSKFYGYFGLTSQSTGGPVSSGVYQSTDAGVTWKMVSGSDATGPGTLLAVDPTNANVLYGSAGLYPFTTPMRLLKSIDGGITWSPLNWDVDTWSRAATALAIDPVHTQILYAANESILGRSVDGGASWQIFHGSADVPFYPRGLLVDPKRPESLLVGSQSSSTQQITFAPDLTLTAMSAATPIAVGAASSFVYTVSNKGPFDATGVIVRLRVPATAQQVSASTNGGTCTVSTSLVSCTFSILRTGASADIHLTATAPSVGSLPVSGSVVADQPDVDSTNNSAASTSTVANVADLAVSITGNTTAHVGDAITFTLTVRNAGPTVASATNINFQLPEGLTAGNVSSTGTCTADAALIACTFGDLAVASPVTVSVNATALSAGSLTSTAVVTTTNADPTSANNSSSVTTVVTAAQAVTPPSSGGSGGGGSLQWWELLGLALCALAGYRNAQCMSQNLRR
jgi:uncharacterized repeat protein (TIGR01451 family)